MLIALRAFYWPFSLFWSLEVATSSTWIVLKFEREKDGRRYTKEGAEIFLLFVLFLSQHSKKKPTNQKKKYFNIVIY